MKKALTPDVEYVPVMTTPAGCSLTKENWEALGIRTFSFPLEDLLIKPGLSVLYQVNNLRHYVGLEGQLVLNARNLCSAKNAIYKIHSKYDGQVIQISQSELLDLINHLSPDILIPPSDWSEELLSLEPSISLYGMTVKEPAEKKAVVYELLPIKGENQQKILYTFEMLTLENVEDFRSLNKIYVETNLPAHNAFQGLISTKSREIIITDQSMATDYRMLDENCDCPPCQQKLTRAYLHHLYSHTPLLCQRLLILHNAYFIKNYLNSF